MQPRTQRFSKSGQVVARRIGETTVLVHLATEHIVELNETGSSIWALIAEAPEVSFEELIRALRRGYEAPEEQLRAEVEAFLGRLLEERLVNVR